jgi:thioredoxin reductase (NADPH)
MTPRLPSDERCEVLIAGAGPAGLTAAIYLARFRRKVIVVDAGQSRARLIPVSHNCPGFPDGVAGPQFLQELRMQAEKHGIRVRAGEVLTLQRHPDRFVASTAEGQLRATKVILATGVRDVLPEFVAGDEAIKSGVVRLCPICDAYETRGKRIGVYGGAEQAVRHARYLRSFCEDVIALTPEMRPAPGDDDIPLIGGVRIAIGKDVVQVHAAERRIEIDALYPVLGVKPASQLGAMLGARTDDNGYLVVDAHLRTSVDGLFAIGDVAHAVNQIAVAVGHAAIAATAVHNALPARPLESPVTQPA